MKPDHPIKDPIALVERRLEVRRERMTRHWTELRGEAARSLKWLPLVAAGGALLLGAMAGRRKGSPDETATKRTGVLATVLTLVGTAMRIASSPPVKAFIAGLRSGQRPTTRADGGTA